MNTIGKNIQKIKFLGCEACLGYFGIRNIHPFLFWYMGNSGILGYEIFWTVYFRILDIAYPLTKPRLCTSLTKSVN